MIDWHSHILPGLDDGPTTIDESVEMARALCKAGYDTVYCTPHLLRGYYEADSTAVRRGVAALQSELDTARIDLRLLPGREYYIDEFLLDYLKEPLPLGESNFILMEVPDHMPAEFVKNTCYRIKCGGFTPMIAHPERSAHFALSNNKKSGGLLGSIFGYRRRNSHEPGTSNSERSRNALLDYLIDIGCSFQGNLGSFKGMYGERVRKSAGDLREIGAYTHFGTDLHNASSLAVIFEEKLGGIDNRLCAIG